MFNGICNSVAVSPEVVTETSSVYAESSGFPNILKALTLYLYVLFSSTVLSVNNTVVIAELFTIANTENVPVSVLSN